MSLAAPISTSSLAFGAFIALLRQNGFAIDIERHIRLEQLLAGAAGNYTPEDLRTWLCPLFASTPEQQQLFYELFESFFARWNTTVLDSSTVFGQAALPAHPPPGSFLAGLYKLSARSWTSLVNRMTYGECLV